MKRTFNKKRALILVCIPIVLVIAYFLGYPVGVCVLNYLDFSNVSSTSPFLIAVGGIISIGYFLVIIVGALGLSFYIIKILYFLPKALCEWLFPKQNEK